ncbi:MAG: DEAD/DEAH box helicase [Betaproteobacteria bacterium]|nr:DEAD/DEAH box helicase [Betaproteobacteria bacterium]
MSDALLRAVTEQGYTEPTPIQTQAIPVILAGRDLFGAAQTGTGKTAGFTLPMLQLLMARTPEGTAQRRRPIRILVLTPTRELAAQVEESIKTYGKYLPINSTVIYGGVGIQPQIDALRAGVDILVATPGRLLDHAQQGTLDLKSVEILVLDEADRMLDMGFIHDIRKVLALLPAQRQNLLFSATFSDDIRKLAGAFLRNPATVDVARRNTPAELVAQVAHPVDQVRKRELLAHLVKSNDWHQVLVFVRTKHGANRLAEQLNRAGVESLPIHGNKSQNARTRALAQFKDGSLRVLVATDIAARGLDIEALPHVVNYDLPHVPEDYVHRIGRTGRAGSEGEAITFVSAEERPLLSAIERLINKTVAQRVVAGFEPGSAPVRDPHDTPEHREQRDQPRRGPRRRSNGGAPRGNPARGFQRDATSLPPLSAQSPAGSQHEEAGDGQNEMLRIAAENGRRNGQRSGPRDARGNPRRGGERRAQGGGQRPASSRQRPDARGPARHQGPRGPQQNFARPQPLRGTVDRDEREAQIREARMRLAEERNANPAAYAAEIRAAKARAEPKQPVQEERPRSKQVPVLFARPRRIIE